MIDCSNHFGEDSDYSIRCPETHRFINQVGAILAYLQAKHGREALTQANLQPNPFDLALSELEGLDPFEQNHSENYSFGSLNSLRSLIKL